MLLAQLLSGNRIFMCEPCSEFSEDDGGRLDWTIQQLGRKRTRGLYGESLGGATIRMTVEQELQFRRPAEQPAFSVVRSHSET